MGNTIKIKKGLDIPILGEASGYLSNLPSATTYAIKPCDINGLIPKMEVAVGDEVLAGTTLFHDKRNDSIKFTSPVSGEVVAINRGAKRVINEIVVLADSANKYQQFDKGTPSQLGYEAVKNTMLSSGAWTLLRQRPFNIIANPDLKPKAIFISGFNSAPLSADVNVILQNEVADFQMGVDALAQLTEGKVYLGLPTEKPLCDALMQVHNVEKKFFTGPHPAGNVGIQIHFISPINKGETVYTIAPQDVVILGRLFSKGIFDTSKMVALVGSGFKDNNYIKTFSGANLETITHKLSNNDNNKLRFISGNILCGTKVLPNGYLGYYDNALAALPEGDEAEFLGWLLPTYERPSASRTFVWLSRIFAKGKAEGFEVNTSMHGEERAYVVSDEYEKVMPMDILPNYLIKAVLANDIDAMENLGIYEVVEEDMALCEFVCTSKIKVQKILREGLNYVEQEA